MNESLPQDDGSPPDTGPQAFSPAPKVPFGVVKAQEVTDAVFASIGFTPTEEQRNSAVKLFLDKHCDLFALKEGTDKMLRKAENALEQAKQEAPLILRCATVGALAVVDESLEYCKIGIVPSKETIEKLAKQCTALRAIATA